MVTSSLTIRVSVRHNKDNQACVSILTIRVSMRHDADDQARHGAETRVVLQVSKQRADHERIRVIQLYHLAGDQASF